MSKITNASGWPITASDIARAFGLRGTSQFPPEGIEESIYIQGHEVWVLPKHPQRMSIRTVTHCLDCNKQLPVGRLAQHHRRVHLGIKPKNQNK
jgi:hypothetical protein